MKKNIIIFFSLIANFLLVVLLFSPHFFWRTVRAFSIESRPLPGCLPNGSYDLSGNSYVFSVKWSDPQGTLLSIYGKDILVRYEQKDDGEGLAVMDAEQQVKSLIIKERPDKITRSFYSFLLEKEAPLFLAEDNASNFNISCDRYRREVTEVYDLKTSKEKCVSGEKGVRIEKDLAQIRNLLLSQ